MHPPFPPARVRLARRIAIAVDVVQVLLVPAMVAPPVGEAVNVAVDVAAAVTMCVLLRPHWAFAPTFVAEAIPFLGAVPFWWAAVMFVTRGQGAVPDEPPGPPSAPPAPRPAPPADA